VIHEAETGRQGDLERGRLGEGETWRKENGEGC